MTPLETAIAWAVADLLLTAVVVFLMLVHCERTPGPGDREEP